MNELRPNVLAAKNRYISASLTCAALALTASALMSGSASAETANSDTATSTVEVIPSTSRDETTTFEHHDPAVYMTPKPQTTGNNVDSANTDDTVGPRLPETGFPYAPALAAATALTVIGTGLTVAGRRR